MQLLASPELTFTGRYFAPLGLGNLMNQRLPRPTLRLAWADLGCPVGAHSVLCCHLHNVAEEREIIYFAPTNCFFFSSIISC